MTVLTKFHVLHDVEFSSPKTETYVKRKKTPIFVKYIEKHLYNNKVRESRITSCHQCHELSVPLT